MGLIIMLNTYCKKTPKIPNLTPPPDHHIPVLITSDITNITPSTATCGGTIKSDGDTAITSKGVCWSTKQNPTIADDITTDGVGPSTFVSNLKNLSPETTYFVRAYSTNGFGTGYGENKSFTTEGGITDIDGNVYETTTIGTQVWLVQNLKTTRLNDGTNIPNTTDNEDWYNLTTSAYCWYDNNEATFKDPYGALYNWYAVNTGKLCPQGWHVATDAEWETLIQYVGDESDAALKLKETGSAHWNGANNFATDEFGFSALPGGYRGDIGGVGDFRDIGANALFWASTEYNSNAAWCREMSYLGDGVAQFAPRKSRGQSVRCIKD